MDKSLREALDAAERVAEKARRTLTEPEKALLVVLYETGSANEPWVEIPTCEQSTAEALAHKGLAQLMENKAELTFVGVGIARPLAFAARG